MSDQEVNPVRCPLCGAPQKRLIEPGTSEVKCEYCGGVFSISLAEAKKVSTCQNHPDRPAVGTCSDCGDSFCENCLTNYELKGQGGESAILSLCPACLRARYSDRGIREILVSILIFVFGAIMAYVAFIAGMDTRLLLITLFLFGWGAVVLIHGFRLTKSPG